MGCRPTFPRWAAHSPSFWSSIAQPTDSEKRRCANPLVIFLRQVAPRRSGAHPPENAVHNGPVVARRAALAPTLGRQELLQQPPLRFDQIASAHEPLPSGGILESRFDSRVNHFVNSAYSAFDTRAFCLL